VFVFTVLTLAVTLTHLSQLHLAGWHASGTQIVTVAWIVIYLLAPVLLLIMLAAQARTPGLDPPGAVRRAAAGGAAMALAADPDGG
jgi:hypothetical protein